MSDHEWWQHRFDQLVRICFEEVPYDPAEHEDCDTLIEELTYGGNLVYRGCITCKPKLRVRTGRRA